MGRGRQKAKQQKIARKLKYLTTDTDYDELAKELGAQEPGSGSFDPFADIEEHQHDASEYAAYEAEYSETDETEDDMSRDDLDEYAKWAAEAAVAAAPKPTSKPHKPIPMPAPGAFKHDSKQTDTHEDE
ncbi:DUF3073 domain-containing protein [Bifidobacterium gallicum]|uniref:DUF3073 domain-containing protein n=1 Tax=Bifidobacterium gallicum DSM 20093 = LMG 11596 TaxID=561180 RepID=D1NW86_9BIFI|nr:DUF3073 domain-containing protein [Bifidobacterium gallicum]EFA22372.1 hypothetical protein BIFGAL_04133 [Bifidobacterium gallicum DSM 20093 = LMG 11596]KFI60080.1 hypothetical protein BGLCM_0100 [Bifidobacterium gallicum DSM 20093 = LMG 11596]